jgi:hypothetical protein
MDSLRAVAAVVVVAFGLCLIALLIVASAKPAVAVRFLGAFANSARAHYLEQVGRLLVGAALVIRSPAMWQSAIFRLIGWGIVISSAVLLCVPWQWHHRLGERMRPLLFRYLRLYLLGAFVFGVLLLYAVFAGAAA